MLHRTAVLLMAQKVNVTPYSCIANCSKSECYTVQLYC